MGELAVRFVVGGLVVSLFAATGELFRPKTFAGLFTAAPSVALATLALAFVKDGAAYAAAEGRTMIAGAFALLAYSVACVATGKSRRVPVWLGAISSWGVWAACAWLAWGLLRAAGAIG